jgi:sugar lactone lactonase YvrE
MIPLFTTRCQLAENPLWHPERRKLYWTDITSGRVYSFDVATGKEQILYEGPSVGGFTFQSNGSLLLFRVNDIAALSHAPGHHGLQRADEHVGPPHPGPLPEERVTDPPSDLRQPSGSPSPRGEGPGEGDRDLLQSIAPKTAPTTLSIVRSFTDDGMERFNDVIADPEGRVFAGTIGQNPKCGLYRVDRDGTITKLFSGTGCSNGMGFSPDLKIFYWTCTTTRRIYAFDYDGPSGELTNRRLFYEAKPDEGLPDGMKVDAEGCIWSARWGGSCVKRHDQTGKIIQHIDVPAANVTSMAFGGEKLDQRFITSAQEPGANDQGGHLFQISVPVRGRAEFKSKIAERA